MGIQELASRLASTTRTGMTPELAKKLKLRDTDTFRGQLLGMSTETNGPLGVYLVGVYVVDDTDFWSDGEIYRWTIPVLGDKNGKARWSALSGLPEGDPPHDVGSHEWMTNIHLNDLPLLAVIPPDPDIDSCTIRMAFYDDDGALADVPKAMGAGYEALAACQHVVSGPDQIIQPVRHAIFTSLRAEQDDILIDQDLILRRGERMNFNCGFVGSVINSMIRVYYFIKDEQRTEQAGPEMLRKGQMEIVRFKSKMEPGGRIALFARGADVTAPAFGELNTDTPFVNKVLDDRSVHTVKDGFEIRAAGPAKFIAFYTPPQPVTV